MNKTVRGRRRLCAAVALAALAALGGAPALAAVVDVDIRGNQYVPAELTVKVGTTVRWTNNERRTSHSVLFTGEGGFESPRFFPGESWEHRFDKPGRYPYTCSPHPEMKGVVVVTD